jgi:phenylacetic acid degradation operon negative regulatory protein
LHLAELREGIWIRPDNLDRDRLPGLRAVLDRQCVHFHDAATDIPAETVRSLFSLDDWASDAQRLTVALRDETDAEAVAADDFAYWFALSVTVVRHLQLDPLLPGEFIGTQWPGQDLRSAYRHFDEVFKQRLSSAFR